MQIFDQSHPVSTKKEKRIAISPCLRRSILEMEIIRGGKSRETVPEDTPFERTLQHYLLGLTGGRRHASSPSIIRFS